MHTRPLKCLLNAHAHKHTHVSQYRKEGSKGHLACHALFLKGVRAMVKAFLLLPTHHDTITGWLSFYPERVTPSDTGFSEKKDRCMRADEDKMLWIGIENVILKIRLLSQTFHANEQFLMQ